jgi:hypothetical protein
MIAACHSSYAECRFFTALNVSFIFTDLKNGLAPRRAAKGSALDAQAYRGIMVLGRRFLRRV